MKEKIRLGVVGLGGRGMGLLETVMLPHDDVDIVALCDIYEDRRQKAAESVSKAKGNDVFSTDDYRELLKLEELDAVVVATSWESHIDVACAAMYAGKYVGMEVGGAYSLEDCWKLVRTYEETGVPCMLLENCCYGRDELLVLNMVRKGLFGEVMHGAGGYCHDLRSEIAFGRENRHYRFENYLNRNCENYPTHELGPIAKILNINRGNQMVSLCSVASGAAGLHDFFMTRKGPEHDATKMRFMQGDVVTTVIKCAHGESITLTLNTTLPRPYSRQFQICGTRASYLEDNKSIFMDNEEDAKDEFCWKPHWGNVENYYKDYEHPVWKKYINEGVRGGHDGMDWLVFRAFLDCIKEEEAQVPIDVYDAAAWMSISVLSEQSIAASGAPIAIPDFTRGMWIKRKPD